VPAAYLFKVAAALILGVLMYRLKVNFTVATIVGVALLGLSIVFGKQIPIRLSYDAWMAIMFVYIIIAAALPVNVLLQPRDYLNSWLLYIGLLIGSVAAATAFKGFSAPALTSFAPIITGGKATPFWPAIVLIVACGSLSGFHSLVGSGTTSKQLAKESDGLTVGYGAMLTEGFLSTLAIMAVAGFGLELLAEANAALSVQNWGGEYTRTVNAIFAKPAVFFVRAYAAMVDQSALSFMNRKIVTIIAGMWVASFAMTTLDTTNRLGRYCFAEILLPLKGTSDGIYRFFTNRWVASVIPAAIGIWLAWSKKFTILWPSFGTANQLIASIALMTGTAWIARRLKANVGMALLPAYVLWLTVTGAIVWFTLAVVLPNALATNSPTEWTVLVIEFVMFALNILFIVDFMKSRHEPAMEEVAQGA
jgi:carbon starvation protein